MLSYSFFFAIWVWLDIVNHFFVVAINDTSENNSNLYVFHQL